MSIGTMNGAARREVAKERTDMPAEDFVSHLPVLRRYARALVHNTADADDLVQDCLVRALSRVNLFHPGTHLRAWLLAILHNIFLDGTRKTKRTREFAKAVALMEEGTVTRANQFHRIELLDIDKALAALPPAQRSTLLLVSVEGLNYAETAKVTGVPVGTVRSRLSRGRSALTFMANGVSCGEQESTGPEGQPTGERHGDRAIQMAAISTYSNTCGHPRRSPPQQSNANLS